MAFCKWIGRILRRNCLLKRVIEGKMKGRKEVTGRRGRRRMQLLVDLINEKIQETETGNSRVHSVEK